MSLAMDQRPKLPSLSAATGISTQFPVNNSQDSIRTLPPLSALLNMSRSSERQIQQQKQQLQYSASTSPSNSAPVSPGIASTDSMSIKATAATADTSNQMLQSVKTPVRLPSFDSIRFNDMPSLSHPPVLQQSKSFNYFPAAVTATPAPAILKITAAVAPTPLNPKSSSVIPTPPSTVNNLSALPLLAKEQVEKQQQQNLVSPLVEKRSYAFISHSPSTFPLHEPSIDNAQLARRKRRRTSPVELSILQDEFLKGQTPNRARRNEIAKKVNMTEKAVQIWFQNRRQTLRRRSNAGKEIHHIEPIFNSQASQQPGVSVINPVSATGAQSTPIRQQLSFNRSPQPFHNQYSSPVKVSNSTLGSSTTASNSSSSPIEANQAASSPAPQQFLTPHRSTSSPNIKSPAGGSSITFRLRNKSQPNVLNNMENESTKMVPISQQPYKQRQKPVMKVNPTPPRVSSNIKENISPNSSPTKNTGLKVKNSDRLPLKELSFNPRNKPKNEDESAVSNLLKLREWK